MKRKHIHIKDQFEGFHAYKDAPEEVAFLRHNHRHIFHVEAYIEVFHNERELEFFMVKEQVRRAAAAHQLLHGADLGSCENIADAILESLKKVYGRDRLYMVEVLEDNENGAIVDYDPNVQDNDSKLGWPNGLRQVYSRKKAC